VYVFIDALENPKIGTWYSNEVLKGLKSGGRMGPVLLRCTVLLQVSQGQQSQRKNGSRVRMIFAPPEFLTKWQKAH
jgi:hypothetical protein